MVGEWFVVFGWWCCGGVVERTTKRKRGERDERESVKREVVERKEMREKMGFT